MSAVGAGLPAENFVRPVTDLLGRLWSRNSLTEDEATDLAVEAQHKTRRRRTS